MYLYLYLLDITLPDGDGYEICQYVKKQKDVPVIFLTAKDEELNVVQGLDMGADDYIIKPFRNRELISRIKSVLRRYYHDEINENQIKFKSNTNIGPKPVIPAYRCAKYGYCVRTMQLTDVCG